MQTASSWIWIWLIDSISYNNYFAGVYFLKLMYFPAPLEYVTQSAGAVEYTDCFSADG